MLTIGDLNRGVIVGRHVAIVARGLPQRSRTLAVSTIVIVISGFRPCPASLLEHLAFGQPECLGAGPAEAAAGLPQALSIGRVDESPAR